MERMSESELMTAIFGENDLGCYPYIVVEEDGNVRIVKLTEAIREALTTLPPRSQKALELRIGLLDGRRRTFNEVGRELSGITGEAARRVVAKALRKLRHPSRSWRLKRFLVPSPEEASRLRRETRHLRDENRSLGEENKRLKKILEGYGAIEGGLDGLKLEEDRAALQSLISRFPNTHVWNAIRRGGVTELSQLKSLVGSGETRIVQNIGVLGRKFLKEVLQKTEKEASP